jgi:NADPH-dependent curcumin reductase CurA
LHLSLLIEEGKIQIPKPTIFTGLSVENVQKAHALLESGHVKGKLVMIV